MTNLISDEEEKNMIYSSLSTQLMIGVYPTEKYVKKIRKKYPGEKDFELPNCQDYECGTKTLRRN